MKDDPEVFDAINIVDRLESITRRLQRFCSGHEFHVRRILDKSGVRRIWAIDRIFYEGGSIPYELFEAWWDAYPGGLWCILDRDLIVGGLGLWPLQKAPYREMEKGNLRESDLAHNCFDRSREKANWYVGGIFLETWVRTLNAITQLLRAALTDWLASGDLAAKVQICAVACSRQGENMLSRLNFRMTCSKGKSVHGFPVYASNDIDIPKLEASWRRFSHR